MTDLTPEAHAHRAAQYLAWAAVWRTIERASPYGRAEARSMRRDYVRMAWEQRRLARPLWLRVRERRSLVLDVCPVCGRPMVVLHEGAACVDCEPTGARGGP